MDITRTSGKRVNAGQGELVTAGGNQTTVRKSWKTLAAVVLGLVLSVPELSQAQYVFTDIDVPGATATAVNANSTHAMAGEFAGTDGILHGFVLNKGVFTTIDFPGAVATVVNPDVTIVTTINGINAPGRFTGTYGDGTTIHSFVWEKGVFTTLKPGGSSESESQSGFLNAQGEVVGGYRDGNRIRHAFIWSKGVFTTIDPPNGHPMLGPVAFGINDPGQVVGTYVDEDGNRHGFLLSKGVYTTLDVPGAAFTVAQGINNAGQIVGLYVDGDDNEHGFVLSKGVYTTIDVPKSTATRVISINAQGEIVGFYVDAEDKQHGFVGTPVR